jgi:hypothetical protein
MSRAKLPAETVIKPCVAAADEYTHSGHLTAGVARKSNEAFASHAAYRERQPRAGKVAVTGGIRPTTTPPRRTSNRGAKGRVAAPQAGRRQSDSRAAALAPITVPIAPVLQERLFKKRLGSSVAFPLSLPVVGDGQIPRHREDHVYRLIRASQPLQETRPFGGARPARRRLSGPLRGGPDDGVHANRNAVCPPPREEEYERQ